jgi:hypothetical protein
MIGVLLVFVAAVAADRCRVDRGNWMTLRMTRLDGPVDAPADACG